MKKSSLFMLSVSAILIIGIFCTGCTDTGSASTHPETNSVSPTVQTRASIAVNAGQPIATSTSATPDQGMKVRDDSQVNQSGMPPGTPPSGTMMNGTRPSGSPPSGMPLNGTRPSGTPPTGGQPPSGSPSPGSPPPG